MTATAGGALEARVQALLALYQDIAATRMHGLPLLNPVLQVQAVGFELVQPPPSSPAGTRDTTSVGPGAAGADVQAAIGILITPWFMNLVWLPLQRLDAAAQVGHKTTRHVGRECFEFITADENGLGSYAACSLFSPMFEFASQQAALATAQAVLAHLRQPVPTSAAAAAATLTLRAAPVPATTVAPAPAAPASPALPVPARRAFLFGRRPATPSAAPPAAPPREAARRG
jgi:[NiFe] hydrogenase assembly HybE family chaperone